MPMDLFLDSMLQNVRVVNHGHSVYIWWQGVGGEKVDLKKALKVFWVGMLPDALLGTAPPTTQAWGPARGQQPLRMRSFYKLAEQPNDGRRCKHLCSQHLLPIPARACVR